MKHFRRLIIFLVIFFAGTVIIMYKPPAQILGEASEALKIYYNVKKADAVNSTPMSVKRDGQDISLTMAQRPYMTQSMQLMAPVNTVPLLYFGTVDVLEDGSYQFCANGHEVIAALGSDDCLVDGKTQRFSDPVILRKEIPYVSLAMLSEVFGGECRWDDEENSVLLTSGQGCLAPGMFAADSFPDSHRDEQALDASEGSAAAKDTLSPAGQALPEAYDMRSDGRVSPVRNQGNLGTCWAFASLGALESSLMPRQSCVFSVDHMSFMSGYKTTQMDGGDFNMALAYLTSWKGPVSEADDPYGDGVSNAHLESIYHLQEAVNIGAKDYRAIKEAVYRLGGVQSSFYSDMEYATSSSSYYNASHGAYFYPGKNIANHDIVIVGWDDHYPKENFNVRPENDGAFLCRNSWGTDFGDGGYFYISYEDTNIGVDNLVYTKVEAPDNYDHIYQSDLLGFVGTMGYGDPQAWFANVYTAKESEQLAAVGFYTTGDNSSYDLFIVRDFTDSRAFDTMEYIKSGYIARSGYYTIDLKDPVPLEPGSRFAVVVRLTTPGSERPVAIEYETGEWTSGVDLSDGEGYLSYNGTAWENIESVYQSNACLKVFTNDR